MSLTERTLANQLQQWTDNRVRAIAQQVANGRAEQAVQRQILRKRVCLNINPATNGTSK